VLGGPHIDPAHRALQIGRLRKADRQHAVLEFGVDMFILQLKRQAG